MNEKKLIECIQNLMAAFDTPIARRKITGDFAKEARKLGREVLASIQTEPSDEMDAERDFCVNVTRIGYGYRTIKVKACSEAEAKRKALDEAGSEEFNEKEVDYVTKKIWEE